MSDTAGRTDRGYLTYLRRLLVQRFTISELRTLCFDLEIDAETLPGTANKLDLVRGMVDYLERRQRIAELVAYLPQVRDDLQLKPMPPPIVRRQTETASTVWATPKEASPASLPVQDPYPVWSYALPGQPMAAPVVLGDVCLIASQESGRGSPGGVLRALSVTSGAVIWEQRFPNAIVGGMVRTDGNSVLVSLPSLGRLPGESALIAVDGSGRILWSTELEVHQISAPAVLGSVAAVTGNSRSVLILDARDGEQLSAVSLPVDVALSAPACDATSIYVPCRAPSLVALTLDGDILWRYEVEGVLSGVQISQTPLVIGETVVAVLSSGIVLALARQDGRLMWESPVGPRGKRLTTPVTDGQWLYVGAQDGVYALRPEDGLPQWVFHTGAYVTAAPVVADNVLCVAGNDRHLYGIDLHTGKLLWQHTMTQETKTSPALTEGDAEGPYAIVVRLYRRGDLSDLSRFGRGSRKRRAVVKSCPDLGGPEQPASCG